MIDYGCLVIVQEPLSLGRYWTVTMFVGLRKLRSSQAIHRQEDK